VPSTYWNGSTSFGWNGFDGALYAVTAAQVNITVYPVNQAPIATNDYGTVLEDGVLNGLSVLANDNDPEGDLMTISLSPVNGPFHGTLTINLNGTYVYKPNPNYYGSDTFAYEVCDNGVPSQCSTAIVFLTITFINDRPVANNDIMTTLEDVPASINVISNDTDIDGTVNPTTVDLDPSTPGIQKSFSTAEGSWSVDNSGLVTYTPKLYYNGIAILYYTVNDNLGSISNIASLTVTVTPVNHPPVLSDVSVSGPEDTDINFAALDFAAHFTDVDGNAMTKIRIVTLPLNGTLKLSGIPVSTGAEISATDLDKLVFTPNANWNGTTSFAWNGFDGTVYASTDRQVNITVTPVNDAPIAVNDNATTSENIPITFNVTSNDTDVDGTINATTVDLNPSLPGIQPSYTDLKGNKWTVNNSGDVTFTPALNYNGPASAKYTVNDNLGLTSNVATIQVNVISVNDPPVAVDDNAATTPGNPVTTDVLANDHAVDSNLVPSTVTILENPLHGSASVNPVNGAVTYTPGATYYASDSYVYQVCDDARIMRQCDSSC